MQKDKKDRQQDASIGKVTSSATPLLHQIVFLLAIMLIVANGISAQFTAVTSGDWDDGATWGNASPGVAGTDYPSTGDDAIIPGSTSDFVVTVNGSEVCANLIIGVDPSPVADADAMVLVSASGRLRVSGDVTMPQITERDIENILDVGDGTVYIGGDLICEASSSGNKNSKDSRIYVGDGTLTIDGDVTFNELNSNRQFFEFLGDGIINFNGSITANKDALKLTAAGNLSTVNFTGSGYGIPFDDFDNVNISGTGAYTNTSGALFNIRTDFTISGSARFDMRDQDMEIAQDFICNSTDSDPLIERTQTVIFDGGAVSNLTHVPSGGNSLTFYNIQVGGNANNRKVEMTGGTITANDLFFTATKRNLAFRLEDGNLEIANAITMHNGSTSGTNIFRVNDGSLTVPGITMQAGASSSADTKLEINGGTVTIRGDVIMEGDSNNNFITTKGISTNLIVSGSITGGDFTNSATSASVLIFNGTGSHTLGGDGGFLGGEKYDLPSLQFRGSDIILGDKIDVEGDLTIESGSLDVTASNYQILLDGDWYNRVGAPGFISQRGTVTFDSGSTQNILTKQSFYNVEATTFDTELTIDAGVQVRCNEMNINGGAKVIYNGSDLDITDLHILTPSTGPSELIINANGVIIGDVTMSGRNSDFTQTAGNTRITGSTEIYSSDVNNANAMEISGGDITLNSLDMYEPLSGTPANSKDARFILSGTGNADINDEIKMHSTVARTYFELQGSGDLRIASHINGGDFKLAGGTGTTIFDGTAGQNIAGNASGTLVDGDSYVFGNVQIENTSAANLQANIQCNNLTFADNGTLDCNTRTLSLRGNFTINGALVDPLIEDLGTVKFNGNASHPTQTMQNRVGSGLTFRRLVISNTSGLAIGVQTNDDVTATIYDHSNGVFSLLNNDFTLNGAPSETSDLTKGSLITSGSASTFTYTDPALTHRLNFSGYNSGTQTFFVGDATNGISITGTNIGDVYFDGAEIYGDVSFTRNKSTTDNNCRGGMIFHGNVELIVNAGSDRWRLGNNNPDIFYGNLDITHNGRSNFIIGRASLGNEYYGKVTLTSSTTGGLYVGRDNNPRPNGNTFYGDFEANVTSSGNIIVANGDSDSPSTVVFDGGDIIFSSTVTSTGRINFGEDDDNFSNITLQNGAKFNTPAGSVLGTTEIRICNIDQTDASVTNRIELTAGARLALGYDAPSSASGNTWAGDIEITAPRIISMVYNTFTGVSSFTKTGTFDDTGTTISNNANGFNRFAGSNTTFTNTSDARWRLGVYGGNRYSGDVTFVASASGLISPCYDATSTFSGNISTVGSASVITFAENTNGLMEIRGTGAMTFDGDDAFSPIVDKLLMNGVGAELDLEVDLTIPAGGEATFTNGVILSDATDMVIFENQTATTNIGSQSSFVDGPVRWSITSNSTSYNLKFPIGKNGEWRAAELDIKHFSVGSAQYTGEMIQSSATALGYSFADATFDKVSGVRYWDLDKTGAATIETAKATLYYSTANNNDFAGEAINLNMVKTNGSGTEWNNIGGVGTADDTGSITSTTNFTTFSKFTLANKAGGSNVLPIELLDFSAKAEKDHVVLDWSTATEINNDYFTIERSRDGVSWEKILEKDGAGNSSAILFYSDKDFNPLAGLSYYRLKQTDFDGQFTYSPLEVVNFESLSTHNEIKVFPNPLYAENRKINIEFEGGINQDVLVQIIDMNGSIALSKAITVHENANVLSLHTDRTLKPGVYTVLVSRSQGISSSTLIVN